MHLSISRTSIEKLDISVISEEHIFYRFKIKYIYRSIEEESG